MSSFIPALLQEIESVMHQVDNSLLEKIAEKMANKRIFIVGEGRSGLMGKSFAMRLMHLGGTVYVVGETISPSIQGSDILVAVSGSGTTKSVVWTAAKAKQIGCEVIAVTADPDSEIGKIGSLVLDIPAATKFRKPGEPSSIQPLGSLFDQCTHLTFDAICLHYSHLRSENNHTALARHSNLES